ncbi:Naringenin,2-oxoglutarate 3-dioxygenase [Platanthera guangdongensis]|uniref:Naringenin,2-oxoglutarate 3-dioxygenase n=1 Tax=Platanthera guangdongensis TaxID=2320717 RepID=A0ABR2M9S7_9ASPA
MSDEQKGGFIVPCHLQGKALKNWREFFTCFSYPIGSCDYSRWPEKLEGWRPIVEEYASKLMDLAGRLPGVLWEAMGLDHEAIVGACVHMDQKLFINFYPKCPQPDHTLGLKHHTDPGTITILLQDHVGGLQATKDGGDTWITIQPVPGAYLVNLGDNGRVKFTISKLFLNPAFYQTLGVHVHNAAT